MSTKQDPRTSALESGRNCRTVASACSPCSLRFFAFSTDLGSHQKSPKLHAKPHKKSFDKIENCTTIKAPAILIKMTDFALKGKNVNVAMMTSGGLAPCLSSSVSQLAKYWIEALKAGEISGLTLRMYRDGYKGVLIGDSFIVSEADWPGMEALNFLGGSPIGNSRVKVNLVVDANDPDCRNAIL